MKRQGILFQGLPVLKREQVDYLQEEQGSYITQEKMRKPVEYIDVTCFLVYEICLREASRQALERMEQERKEELMALAEKSRFQGMFFWQCLDRESQKLGKCVIGLLEELRGEKEEKQELAWVGFWYLIHKGFQKEYLLWLHQEKCAVIRRFSKQKGGLFMCGQVCINLLIAQELGVEIIKDENYTLFCERIEEWKALWELSKEEAALKFCQKLLKKNQKQGTIKLGRNWFYLCDVPQ